MEAEMNVRKQNYRIEVRGTIVTKRCCCSTPRFQVFVMIPPQKLGFNLFLITRVEAGHHLTVSIMELNNTLIIDQQVVA